MIILKTSHYYYQDITLGSRSFINSAEVGLPCAQLELDLGDTAGDKAHVVPDLMEGTVRPGRCNFAELMVP